MSQQKEQQPTTIASKLEQLKSKLPEGKMKESVIEKLKTFDKPIQK